jgi:hypothetical protein
LPDIARYDALHIATAAVNGIKYLVIWNYAHLANPDKLDMVEAACRGLGYEPPRIVTPDQLLVSDKGTYDVE